MSKRFFKKLRILSQKNSERFENSLFGTMVNASKIFEIFLQERISLEKIAVAEVQKKWQKIERTCKQVASTIPYRFVVHTIYYLSPLPSLF
jgi:hypothetical protein